MEQIQKLEEQISDLRDEFNNLLDYLDGLNLKVKADFNNFRVDEYDSDEDIDNDSDEENIL